MCTHTHTHTDTRAEGHILDVVGVVGDVDAWRGDIAYDLVVVVHTRLI